VNIINLKQRAKLKELREKYKYDISLTKQSSFNWKDEKEELIVLASTKLSESIYLSVKDFLDTVEGQNITHLQMILSAFEHCSVQLQKSYREKYSLEEIEETIIETKKLIKQIYGDLT